MNVNLVSQYIEILNETHILIAGTTGSGKSTLLNGLMHTLLATHYPTMILIDLKRVELARYRDLKSICHEIKGLKSHRAFCTDSNEAIYWLKRICEHIDERYKRMEKAGIYQDLSQPIYIIIDEFACLIEDDKKRIIPLLIKIMRLGRACGVHLIACTQSPNRHVLPAEIVQNFTCRIGLRCSDAIESRQVIGQKGCELLPRYGSALIKTADGIKPLEVVKVPDYDIDNLINFRLSTDRG